MTEPIRRGHIFWVPDSTIRLPPNDKRDFHRQRPFLVLSNDTKNTETTWPIVFGCPLSTSDEHATEFDVPLPKGAGGVPYDCYVLVVLAQAIAKSKLRDRTGQLDANVMEEIIARQLEYQGIITRPT